jgi:eukaryotic-like serine/threonine-protein kinase
MSESRWSEIERVCQAALERPPESRAAFLAEACGNDEMLRREVESLLAQLSRADSFIETPALEMDFQREPGPRLTIGQRVGIYQVVSWLGAGGMGEVYRARDTELHRDIALKVLPTAPLADAERLARFEREARVLAALNHPNVGAIYGLTREAGLRALVLELVEGETLADKLAHSRSGTLPVNESLAIARQIAEALEAAHERGIIHRDLKPANVKITSTGVVKVLDFGLAKLATPDRSSSQASNPTPSLTITSDGTRGGLLLGTARYMSPEQARGQAVDKRTDIWAFGCVLYEMLTGQPTFPGATVTDTLAAIVEREPEWTKLPVTLPPNIRTLLRRCLEKDATRRLRDIGDARLEIDEAGAAPAIDQTARREQWVATTQFPSTSASGPPWIIYAIASAATLVVIALLALAYVGRWSALTPSPLVRFTFAPPFKSSAVDVAVSPEGDRIALSSATGDSSLWLRAVDSFVAQEVPGTERAFRPFWFSNGEALGFIAQTEGLAGLGSSSELRKIEVAGGRYFVKRMISPISLAGGALTKAGVVLYQPELTGTPLFRVDANGGVPAPVTRLNLTRKEITHRYPQFLPDGRHFIYWVWSADGENTGICVGSLNADERLPKCPLIKTWREARYADPGWLLFIDGARLVAQRFDSVRLSLIGEPHLLPEEVARHWSATGWAMFSVSSNRVLAYQQAVRQPGAHIVWRDRAGRQLRGIEAPLGTLEISLNANEKQLVAAGEDENTVEVLWFVDLERGTLTRLTTSHASDYGPVWSPDDKRVAFASNRTGIYDLYVKDPLGGGEDQLMVSSPHSKHPSSWSSDGRLMVYDEDDPKTGLDIWILPFDGTRTPFSFLKTDFNESRSALSPVSDSLGRVWMAYQSDEAGSFEIYLRPLLPAVPHATPGAKVRVSIDGGLRPKWRKDGRELFFISNGKLMAVDVKLEAIPSLGAPHELFDAASAVRFGYEPLADGKRFLLIEPDAERASATINVVLNWAAELK